MKKCPDCGADLDENLNECIWCGCSLNSLNTEMSANVNTEDDIAKKVQSKEVNSEPVQKPSQTSPPCNVLNQTDKKTNVNAVLIAVIIILSAAIVVLGILLFSGKNGSGKSSDFSVEIKNVSGIINEITDADDASKIIETDVKTRDMTAFEAESEIKVNEGETETEPLTEPAQDDKWKDAYAAKLSEYYSEQEAMYSVYDLDENGIPELFVSTGTYHVSGVEVYTYRNGQCVQLTDKANSVTAFGTYGRASINVHNHMIIGSDSHMDITSADFHVFDGENITCVLRYYYSDYTPERGLNNEYNLNGENISKEELDAKAEPYRNISNASDTVSVGRDFSIFDTSGLR